MARAELAPVIALRAPVSGEDELSRLRRAVDLPRLIEVGYDPRAHIIRPHAEHPVFGYAALSGRPLHGCCGASCTVRGLLATL